MQYYRNYELAKQYNVSQSAVGKWIESVKKGKLGLSMIEREGKSYIAATTKNHTIIKGLVEERKKYMNSKSHKNISVVPDFYELFAPDQIVDIINSLDIRSEIPPQYSYFGAGASNWAERQEKLAQENSPNATSITTPFLLELNRNYLDSIAKNYTQINVIDIGQGTSEPVKDLLTQLVESEKMGTYLAMDLSPDMIAVSKRNVNGWFGKKVLFDGEIRDVTHERFADVITDITRTKNPDDTLNLVLFTGNTLGLFPFPDEILHNIYHSLGRNDLLIFTQKIDTVSNRRLFDIAQSGTLNKFYKFMPDLLGIEDDFYDLELGFDETRHERYAKIILKVALTINFILPHGQRSVELNKGEGLTIWRYKHQTADETIEFFAKNGFNVLQASQAPDNEHLLLICNLKIARQ